ncbi:MAG: hypothetical protein HKN07_02580 [Acidimicrobiia bacterium]|nr:hypothetical protein [Acidimicrobiia bacterium]
MKFGPVASRVAATVSGDYPLAGTYHEERFAAQAPELVARASTLVEAETGLRGVGEPEVAVIGRLEWVENNVRSFGRLLEPLTEKMEDGLGKSIARPIVGIEMGAVLGLLSRRVLGQYELVLPSDDGEFGDTVLFVGANILAMERQFEFRPDEFRFWVALHECTHRLQFVGVPWLRSYFLDLVRQLVANSRPEQGRLRHLGNSIKTAAAEGKPLIDETGLFGLFATGEQRQVLDQVQALMSLLEGHGHVVMDRIGERELAGQARMSALLKQRRNDPRTAALFRILGLEMKMRQYDDGAKFIEGVERHAGWESLDAAWVSAEHLPTLEEIANPVLWLDRVA